MRTPPSPVLRRGLAALLALTLGLACGDDDEEADREPAAEGEGEGEEASADTPDGPLLVEAGELADGDPSDARGPYDRFFVNVNAGDQLVVTLTSDAFDPVLEVTPPNQGMLVNDDYQGDLTRSQLELVAQNTGAMKVEVRAYAGRGRGAYELRVARAGEGDAATSTPVLRAGDSRRGELTDADQTLSDGARFDPYVVDADGPIRIAVTADGTDAPRTSLVGPDGLTHTPEDGRYESPRPGTYRLQVIGAPGLRYRVSVERGAGGAAPLLARAHHQFNRIIETIVGAAGGGGSGGAASPDPAPDPAGGVAPGVAGDPDRPRPVTPARALPVRVGDRLNGNLAENDPTLPSGEHYDVYELTVAQPGGEVAIDLESSAFDCFLRVDGPNGQHWENDDHAGTLNSRVMLSLDAPGTYRIVTTSYRPGERGPYELKVLTQRDAAVAVGGGAPGAPPSGTPSGPAQEIAGELAQGDRQLQSGELVDEHRFTWPAGARVHLEARSTDFDTYLIVHPPSGPQRDNDDMRPGESLNAGMDLQVSEAGEWRVLVTSYQPGETGRYTLVVQGAEGGGAPAPSPSPTPGPTPTPTPAPSPPQAGARVTEGELAQGDQQLGTGEFSDTIPMTFTPRSSVSIRLESSDFDTYLIVRSPSGHQEDNDDLASGNLNSGVDIPVAEPGNYRIIVTSYRPGETGRYRLTVTEGDSVVDPSPPPSGGGGGDRPPSSSGGGRVWGLFAGITDYPGSTNDLPECANDARKLAEAVRNQGNMPQDQEFLLTDSQATTANIRQAMQTVASRIRPDDVFVFFYSGHGGQTDTSSDPDELDRRDEYLFVYDGQIMDDEMGQLFDRINSRISLVAIDACFAGGFAKDVITQPGRVGMFSSEEDVTSAVAGRFQAGGYLSHFLRLGINGEADNDPHNQILTVGELTHYTWRQFGQHASDVRMSMGYQHLVVDRGAVHTNEVLWAVRR